MLFHEHLAVDYSTAELQSYRRVVNIKSLLGAAHMIELEPGIFILNTHVDLTVYKAIVANATKEGEVGMCHQCM